MQTLLLELAIVAVLLGVSGCHRSARKTAAGDPPTRVARLGNLAGTVSFEAAGSNRWVQGTPNYTLTTGDRLVVGRRSRAELDFGQGVARVGDDADLTLTNLTGHFAQLGLAGGVMDASVYRWVPGDSIELDTPNGALLPQDAGAYRLWIDPNDNSTVVSVERGALLVTGPGVSQMLQAAQTVRLSGTNPIEISSLAGPSLATAVPAEFAQWSGDRDRTYQLAELAPGARYVNQQMPGWSDLVEDGRWVSTPTYGQAWCPDNVSTTWVPYRTGHWAWVDPWGWTWVDDAPWGYTTSHYGRWLQMSSSPSCGWAWVPAATTVAPVYAPALVSFVEGLAGLAGLPNVDGWFPLGPQEPYLPWYGHSDTYLRAINIADLGPGIPVDQLLHEADDNAIMYVNRPVALTIVPTTVLASGDPVAREAIRLPPGQLARAARLPIAVQPPVRPSPRLLAGGPPGARPFVAARPPISVHGGGGARSVRAPQLAATRYARAPHAAGTQRFARGGALAPHAPRPIISRNAGPPRRPAYSPARARRPAAGGRGVVPRAAPARPARVQARAVRPAAGRGSGGRGMPTPRAAPTRRPPVSPRPAQPAGGRGAAHGGGGGGAAHGGGGPPGRNAHGGGGGGGGASRGGGGSPGGSAPGGGKPGGGHGRGG